MRQQTLSLLTQASLFDTAVDGTATGIRDTGIRIPKFCPIASIQLLVQTQITSALNNANIRFGAGTSTSALNITFGQLSANPFPSVAVPALQDLYYQGSAEGNRWQMGANTWVLLNVVSEALTTGKFYLIIQYYAMPQTPTAF